MYATIAAFSAGTLGLVVGGVARQRPDSTLFSLGWAMLLSAGIAGLLVGRAIGYDGAGREEPREGRRTPPLHDAVTGLPNRLLARDRLMMALHQARRTGDPVALVHLTVEGRADLVGRLGADGADEVLRGTADRIRRVVRPHDTVARTGPSEFIVICPGIGSEDRAQQVVARLAGVLADPLRVGRKPVAVEVGLDLTLTDGGEADTRELLLRVGRAIPRSGQPVLPAGLPHAAHTDGDHDSPGRRLDELRRAFDFDELCLEYQPIVDLASGVPVAIEALIRWRHPERGLLPAADFVELLESTDLVERLSELSLGHACRDAAALRSEGMDIAVHVNLGERQLARQRLVDEVEHVLAVSGLDPEALTLEITETRLLPASPWLVARIAALRALGVRIAIDDFGTGFAGLSRLLEVEVDMLKLDRSFVGAIDLLPNARAVCEGVLSIAAGLGIGSIAEGIETEAQEAEMTALGCDRAQGNLYSPAVPFSQVRRWLADRVASPR
ncbi:MAG TPA: bifunctional diguanylate cyclase/phosphodiesterase [Nocardioides sp.]|nr:bifunctional diguanylate cyclase/phosphodiesterase [Nocardioides sp.]